LPTVRVAGRVRPVPASAEVVRAALAGLFATLLLTAPAPAQTGGASPTPTPTPLPAGPPVPAPAASAPPVLTALVCVRDCAGQRVRPGSLVRLRGRRFDAIDTIVFVGGPSPADDVAVPPAVLRSRSLDLRVPHAAVSGPVVAVTLDAVRSAPLDAALVLAAAPAPRADSSPSIDVEVTGQRLFYGAQRGAQLTYALHGPAPAQVVVEVVRTADGVPIARWSAPAVAPETPQVVSWDGMAGGRVQREGRYHFRVSAQDQAGATAITSQIAPGPADASAPGAFVLLRQIFPIRGPHRFGTGAGEFGGPRGHQGQDTFAACGTPLVAARGGVVKYKGTHPAAGNYLVIDGAGTGVDNAYMHLRAPSPLSKGDKVLTGQPIGVVGRTGDATACHLHFEEWSAPGWYTGGHAVDPMADLKAWDTLT
jgi:murein DD-endopeptidase MepM/ murein hydrolase activator NlpD